MTHGNKGVQDQVRKLRRRECERKIAYTTEEEADLGRRRSMRVFKEKLRIYLCPSCGKYHLAH